MPSFNDFQLQPSTRDVLASMNITEPSPIQAQAIPVLLAGKDLIGQSATGSGKTLAYSIPLVERLSREKRVVQALIVVPTRELAVQVNTVLSKLASSRRLTTALLVGGRPYNNQISALRYGSQIVVGTPGRIKDHLDRGTLVLSQLRICVLDEADQMLDIGFAPIIEEILSTTPETRQMALFSATIPEWIAKLQEKFLKDPVKVEIAAATGAESTIEQIAYQVPHDQKMAALCTLLNSADGESSLIFGRTKFGVEKLGKQLSAFGFTVGTLHGDKSQRAREDVLAAFRQGRVQTLLATNVAARGLDIKGIYQVINYELPESSELFTHRIGRTGRMGHQGKAITLLIPSDLPKWRRMARTLGQEVTLLRLAINHDATAVKPSIKPAAPVVVVVREENNEQRPAVRSRRQFSSEREQYSEPRPMQGRRQFSPDMEREREQRPMQSRPQFTPERERGQNSERPMRNRPQGAWTGPERGLENDQRPVRARKQFASEPQQEQNSRQRPAYTRPQFEWPETEREQSTDQRPVRARKQFASEPERGRSMQARPDSQVRSDFKKNSPSSETQTWQPEEGLTLPERPAAAKMKDGRKVVGRPAVKATSHAITTTEPQRVARRKPAGRKTGTSAHFVSR